MTTWSDLLSGATPIPIALLIYAVIHLKKNTDKLEAKINVLNHRITLFARLLGAVRSCPISECFVRKMPLDDTELRDIIDADLGV